MILMIADGQPCSLRFALPEDGQKIAFMEIRSSRELPCSLHRILDDVDLELAVIECVYGEKNGLTILDGIKHRRPDVPVIFVCAAGSDHAAKRALDLGARECFQKPVQVTRFREQVRNLQKLKRSTWEQRMPLRALNTKGADPDRVPSDMPETIVRAVCYIEDHLTERELCVSRLARIAGMSLFHFCRMFKRHTTRSPMQYVAFQRVRKSQELLRDNSGNLSVSGIAAAVGFYDASNFNRTFKRITGLTPSAFKQSSPLLSRAE